MGTSKETTSKLPDHSARAHALLSASGANRWINCTPSARLEEQFGEKTSSSYATEGTLAHELAEVYLSKDVLDEISEDELEARLEEIMNNELFNEEMLDMVPIYTNYCVDQYHEAIAQHGEAEVEVEAKLDLTEFVPDSFGTGDFILISDGTLEVVDLKYGKGVPVYATWNKQLMLYALGALRKYDTLYDIENVRLTIVQPRLNNISSFDIPVADLIEWAVTELKPKAEQAYKGEGSLEPGEWCKFCSVKNQCRKLYEKQIEIAKYEFADPPLLSDEEISDILTRLPELLEWASAVKDFAQAKAIKEGKHWPGFKLVEGLSRRKWNGDDDTIANAIVTRLPELDSGDIYDMKLKSLSTIEKMVGKKRFAETLSDMVVKPAGAPTLVPESDKRPALGDEQAKIDFAN